MCLHCDCPLGIHRPGCPLGSSGGPVGTTTNVPVAPAPARGPWFCPRCSRVNAPHVDQCSCPPLAPGGPVALPSPFYPAPGERALPIGNDDGWKVRITYS